MTEWFWLFYDMSAYLGAFTVIFVMQQTDHDRSCNDAPQWLRQVRRVSFIIIAIILLTTIWSNHSVYAFVAAVESGIIAIVINGVALHKRDWPRRHSGHRSIINASSLPAKIFRKTLRGLENGTK